MCDLTQNTRQQRLVKIPTETRPPQTDVERWHLGVVDEKPN